jgi:type II secretory pathway pseudopilin PulG
MNPAGSRPSLREERELWIGRVALLAVASSTLLFVFLDLRKSYHVPVERRRANRTMARMRELASSVEAYAVEKGKYPSPAGSISGSRRALPRPGTLLPPAAWPVRKNQRASGLQRILSLRSVGSLPTEDAWGHPLLYATTEDRRSYAIVSTGRDGTLEPPDSFVRGQVWDTRRDLVYGDGGFFVWIAGT